MKKTKLLLTIPAFVAPATLALSQCSKNATVEEGVFLDKEVSTKATMELRKDSQQNQICEVKLNDELIKTNKFTSVKVTFNGVDLKDDEYETDFEEVQEGKIGIRIFKTILDSKKGRYVVSPTIEEKQLTGIIAELQRITYHIGEKVTTNNITVYKSLEGTQTDVIPWTENIKVYENDSEITDFKTNGISLTTLDARTLKIVYNDFYTFVKVNVSKKEFTITCSIDKDECGTLSASSFVAKDGDVWGPLSKPSFQPKEDVDAFALTWDWYDSNDVVIPGTKVIDSSFNANLKVEWSNKQPTSVSKTVDTAYDKWGADTYIPAENVQGEGEQRVLIPMEYDYDNEYTISFTVPTGKKIKYFWIGNADEYKAGDLVYLYKRNILSLTIAGTAVTNYSVNDYYNKSGVKSGSYVDLGSTVTEGQQIILKIRMLKNISCIPAFEAVA